VDDLQPEVEREVRGLENGPHPHSEGLTAGVALVEPRPSGFALELTDALFFPAVIAAGAVRPELAFDVCECRRFVLEMRGGKDLRGDGTISYGPDTRSCGWVCQV
jgi:hypothetical protein